jgi:hypothetical protein
LTSTLQKLLRTNELLRYGLLTGLLLIAVIALSQPDRSRRDDGSTMIPQSASLAPLRLRDEAVERGIRYTHLQVSDAISGLDEALGAGACALDIDDDLDMDIYLVGGSGHQRFYGKPSWWSKKHFGRMYLNAGGGYFTDITESAGLEVPIWGMGCNAADFDHDGKIDLLVTGRHKILLFRNLGANRFEPVALPAAARWATSAALGDYNRDGWMDIYLGNYLAYEKSARKFESRSGFESSHSEFEARNFAATSNQLLTNLGDFKFRSNAAPLGIDNADGRTLAARWLDFNDDDWPDLLVMNDSGSVTRAFVNRAGDAFESASVDRQIDLPSGIRDAAVQDYDNDGDLDILLSTSLGESPILLRADGDRYQNVFWQIQANSSAFAGLSGFGVAFADLNNDGIIDIFHGNGLLTPDPDAPAISAGQPDRVSLGDGFGGFSLAEVEPAALRQPVSTRAAIGIDIDDDGDRDLLVTANNNPARLLINDAPVPAWIGFDIFDRYGNHGYFKSLQVATSQRKLNLYPDADTFLGRNDPRISALLAAGEQVDSVTIRWWDGKPTELAALQAGAYHRIRQGDPQIETYSGKAAAAQILPSRWAVWQLKAGDAGARDLLASFRRADTSARREMAAALADRELASRHLAILRAALEDADREVVVHAIRALRAHEFEIGYYWLAELFEHPDRVVLCELAETFRHFYIEEEAMVQRKGLAVSHLVRLLDHESAEVVVCALRALAESKNYRAVVPIERLLARRDDSATVRAAIDALGELRHTRSIQAILDNRSEDPELLASRELALRKLNRSAAPRDSVASASLDTPRDSKCPQLPAPYLLALPAADRAERLVACGPVQLRAWITAHRDQLEARAQQLLDNADLSSETFIGLVDGSAELAGSGVTRVLIGLLEKRVDARENRALLAELQARMPSAGLEKLLKHRVSDTTLPIALRIAAADALIGIDPQYVFANTRELFQ